MKSRGKVFVGMSGGVDSSVAAALLKEQGYEVVGVHLKCFNVDGCAAQDAEDARRAAEHLGIPFYTFDYEKEYKKKVVEYMVDGYKKGITPNPDVMCNKEIKFGLFYKKAMELGADYVATGHYVRLRRTEIRNEKIENRKNPHLSSHLLIACDLNKDQSYFLWAIKPEQLAHCLFPIGEYKKPQVRKLAVKFGLHNAAKKDSQGICFLGQVSLPDFLKRYIKPKKGDILLAPNGSGSTSSPTNYSPSGVEGLQKLVKIGTHNGAHFYTIGQRHGLNIGSRVKGLGSSEAKPLYVSAKDVRKNIIVVAEGDDNEALYRKEVNLVNVNLFADLSLRGAPLAASAGVAGRGNLTAVPAFARVRYRQPLQKAILSFSNSQEHWNRQKLTLRFVKPVKFVAEGQSAVFYDAKGALLGGGVIN